MKIRQIARLGLCLGLTAILGCSIATAQETACPRYQGTTYYDQRLSHFHSLPTTKGAIIFLGNSITDGAEWHELFPRTKRVLNRGISGDRTEGILNRLDEVVRHQPKKVFLLIGTNDLNHGLTAEAVTKNILEIAERIGKESPKTKLFVQSILPVNDALGKFQGHTKNGDKIVAINKALREKAGKLGYTFVDLHSSFAGSDGKLRLEFTNDGLHLTGAGYQHWITLIKPYL